VVGNCQRGVLTAKERFPASSRGHSLSTTPPAPFPLQLSLFTLINPSLLLLPVDNPHEYALRPASPPSRKRINGRWKVTRAAPR
jgi:hypothetical protein